MLDRLLGLVREAAKFGVVGAVGFIVDVGLFNLLRFAGDPGVLDMAEPLGVGELRLPAPGPARRRDRGGPALAGHQAV